MGGMLLWLILSTKYLEISGTIPSEGPESTYTACYGHDDTLIAICTASRIAMTGFYYGFKLESADCRTDDSCCSYVESTDCLEEAVAMDTLSGREDGSVSTSNMVRQSCNESYSMISSYNLIKYQCIGSTRIYEMCTSVNSTSTHGKPLYLWNNGYPDSGIFAEVTSCTCSVVASSLTADITLYIIHMDLYDDPSDCHQSITMTNGSGSVLHRFQCETPVSNTIRTVTVEGPYITVNMANSYTSSAGTFWIRFEVIEPAASISMNCPATAVPDCGHPPCGEHTTLTTSGTVYSSVAVYNCTEGYVYRSGNYRRFCLMDGQWNGTALVCVHDCGTPALDQYSTVTTTDTVYGSVAVYTCIQGYLYKSGDTRRYCLKDGQWNGTLLVCTDDTTGEGVGTIVGVAFGALTIGILVGATGLFVCHRLKRHLHRQDVSGERSLPRGIDKNTTGVNVIQEYVNMEFDEFDVDRTYSEVLP